MPAISPGHIPNQKHYVHQITSATLQCTESAEGDLSPGSPLLRHLALLGLLLLLQELLLLLGVHLAESAVALLLLELLGLHAALLGLLLVVELAQLAGFVVTGGADLAEGFGAEVSGADEVVWHAKEGSEERGRGWLGVETHGEVDTLAGDQVVESGRYVSNVLPRGSISSYFLGASMGWSVMIRASRSSPASVTALIRSGVSMASVTSALSLMTVAQSGSLAWSSVVVREIS